MRCSRSISRAHAVRDGERVGGRLAHDAEADRGLAGLVELEAVVLGADLDPGDLAEPDEIAVLAGDDDLLELLRRGEARIRLHGQLALRRLDAAARQLDVLALDRVLDVLRR